jgi:porphobilinogen synthase
MTNIVKRPRRLRKTKNIRNLVRETELKSSDFIMPYFVVEGSGIKNEIKSMPGNYQMSVDSLLKDLDGLGAIGVRSILLFGIPGKKDDVGTEGYSKDGIIQKTIREVKKQYPEISVVGDVCLCEYTSHGHCGVVENDDVDNDKTLALLSKMALAQAEAGVDLVAPSDMMDGRVRAIRRALDEGGFTNLPIMSYAAKYASAYYGPFRDAAESAPEFGDRKTYQMDPANAVEALKEVALDIEEGADIVMVKPALAYLDIIRQVKDRFHVPVAAYNVSGEYSMIKAAAQLGYIDHDRVMMETLTSIKRAGADIIITYFAKEAAALLKV